ncbi:MAG: hypothetical protein IIZ73_00785, partial [Ruminococcus sp.]|nr:hypothetical protein [Ruminococcus sp.]
MTAAVILLSIAAAVLLAAVILQRQEMESAAKQISVLKEKDTNGVVHSVNGTAVRLIDEINGLLGYIRSDRIEYARKNHDLEKMMTNISHDLRTPLTS